METTETTDFSSLPNEIVELILEEKSLSFVDVCNFGSTNSRYYDLVFKSNQIWKTKFKQMWPSMMVHDIFKHRVDNWREDFTQRLIIGRKTMALVKRMSYLHIKQMELSDSDLTKFEELWAESEHELTIYFMIDELMNCLFGTDRDFNLTIKYYGEKALRHLRQLHIKKKWEEFKNAPVEEQLLEHGAVIVAQWSQPIVEISKEAIASKLDGIAVKVLEAIRQQHGDKHPALCVPKELRALWRSRNLADNHYTPYVSRQVIETVSKVLFKDLGFYGNSELYYCHENSYINKVLENGRGIPITLSILYESVARRLGVKCEPVSFPGHFLLRWRDTYTENTPSQYFYIDVFNGGVFLGKDSCPQFATAPGRCPITDIFRFGPAAPIQVVERMANNLEVAGRQRNVVNGRSTRLRSALELLHLVNPGNLHCMLQLARFYMQYNMDVARLYETVQKASHFDLRDMGQASYILQALRDYMENYRQHHSESAETLEVKRRDPKVDVAFAVGMVMQHHRPYLQKCRTFGLVRYNYSCVIIGWDLQCVASVEWKNQMHVKSLRRQDRQPFYHVLVNDGTNRYAAEENLRIETEPERCWINHCDIGRYFDSFSGRHYRMNEEMLQAYPDDRRVIEKEYNLK